MQLRLSLPPSDKCDHNSILLIPAYNQKLKHEVSVALNDGSGPIKQMLSYRTVSLAEWNMFQNSSEFTTSVTNFINKFIEDVIPSDLMYISKPKAMDYRQHPH